MTVRATGRRRATCLLLALSLAVCPACGRTSAPVEGSLDPDARKNLLQKKVDVRERPGRPKSAVPRPRGR